MDNQSESVDIMVINDHTVHVQHFSGQYMTNNTISNIIHDCRMIADNCFQLLIQPPNNIDRINSNIITNNLWNDQVIIIDNEFVDCTQAVY